MFKIWLVVLSVLVIAMVYANYWGMKECKKLDGNWIKMNGGTHCVDQELKIIDIYN